MSPDLVQSKLKVSRFLRLQKLKRVGVRELYIRRGGHLYQDTRLKRIKITTFRVTQGCVPQ